MKLIHIVQIKKINSLSDFKCYYFDNDHDATKCEKYFLNIYNDAEGIEPTYEVDYYTEHINVAYDFYTMDNF
jgi:hypothetical protein